MNAVTEDSKIPKALRVSISAEINCCDRSDVQSPQ